MTKEELKYLQALPLYLKVSLTRTRLREFINEYGEENVYISFSGGKDSLVLLHIARSMYPNLHAVYLDTWLEMPDVRVFVKKFDNIEYIKPKKDMKTIIRDNGWCFPSKDVSQLIAELRKDNPSKWAIQKVNGLDSRGNYSEYRQRYKKWKCLVDSPFKISDGCCFDMKEIPVAEYEKATGRHPILALMASESARRENAYLKTGCNSFDTRFVTDSEGNERQIAVNRPISKPMGFWTENDVLRYIYENKLEIAKSYGEILVKDNTLGQLSFFDYLSADERKGCSECAFCTTGEKRTGCAFCPVGCHLDGFQKFNSLKKAYPKLHDYCMEELGEKELIAWIKRNLHLINKNA